MTEAEREALALLNEAWDDPDLWDADDLNQPVVKALIRALQMRDAVLADMAEIDRIAVMWRWGETSSEARNQVAALAAKHRKPDPLVEAIGSAGVNLVNAPRAKEMTPSEIGEFLIAAVSKRGIELARKENA